MESDDIRTPGVKVNTFVNPAALGHALADRVAGLLREAIRDREKASLVVPGGKTPRPFFRALHDKKLNWGKVYITLTDERWVATNVSESNEKLVREELLHPESHFIGLKNSALNPEMGKDICQHALASMPRPFDVVVLGMGKDGHIASLFSDVAFAKTILSPNHPLSCVAIRSRSAREPRVSLTLSKLLQSRNIFLCVTGAEKQKVLLDASEPGEITELPVRGIIHQYKVPVEVFWSP